MSNPTEQPMTRPAAAEPPLDGAHQLDPIARPELSTPPDPATKPAPAHQKIPEIGGPEGPEPTRYGDWERKGRCIDF